MKKHNIGQAILILLSAAVVCLGTGCVERERVTTYDVSKSGKNWAESESVQKYTGTDGKTSIEKQHVYEKIKCVNRKGQKISADSNEECLKKGGKIVDEMTIEEESIRSR